jgi:hypothetical protein
MFVVETLKHGYNKLKNKAASSWEKLKLKALYKYKQITSESDFDYHGQEYEYLAHKAYLFAKHKYYEAKEEVRHEMQMEYEQELVKARERGEDIDF